MTFYLLENQVQAEEWDTLSGAVAAMRLAYEEHMSEEPETPVTFTVVSESGQALDFLTNRRIMAVVHRQQWVGPKEDRLLDLERPATVDATTLVLNLDWESFKAIEDYQDSSDFIKEELVEHDGPFDVEVVNSVHEFFGSTEISFDAFQRAKEMLKPKSSKTKTLVLTVRLEVAVQDGIDEDEIVDELDYTFTSGTDGATVRSSEISDSEWV